MNLDAEARAYLTHESQQGRRIRMQRMPWKPDPRSAKFDHDLLFGAAPELKPLNRPRGPVLDQGYSIRCGGYGSAANGWYIHGIPMNPDWSAHKIGQKQGRSVDEQGSDPNAVMKHMRDDGFLPQSVSDMKWQTHSMTGTGMGKFSPSLDFDAKKYDTIAGYVKITNRSQDYFDAIANALTLAYDEETKRGPVVDAFSAWRSNWDARTIPDAVGSIVGYHRYVFIDIEKTPKNTWLVSQNSYGTDLGDGGFQYWSRDVINFEFSQWGTSLKILKHLTPEQIEEAKKETRLGKLIRMYMDIMWGFSERFGRYA